jgi:hypothetical protein
MKTRIIAGIVLVAISIGLLAYAEISINLALPEYNYASYTDFRFSGWYNLIMAIILAAGLMLIQLGRNKKTPSQDAASRLENAKNVN